MTATATLERLEASGVIMVSRAGAATDALAGAYAAHEGGVTATEVTFTVPDAPSVIQALRRRDQGLVVGAGTVLTLEQARRAVGAGAEYLVSPGLDDDIVRFGVDNDVLVIPGVLTPSEIMRAVRLGCLAVKLFPASTVGVDYVRSVLAPLPDLAIIPSGGVSSANAGTWIAAGCRAVGVGGALSPTGRVDDSVARQIRTEAEACIAAVASAREVLTTRKAR